MPRYADLDNLIADYLPEATKQSDQDAIERILDNVSAFVDSYCRRPSGYFASVLIEDPENEGEMILPEPTMRRFRGEGERFLRLPVHVFGSIEQVTTSYGTVINSDCYYESEKNGWLYAEDSLYPEASFDLTSQNIWTDGCTFKVTAVWGYRETPLPVQEFCRLATVSIRKTQKGVLGQISPEGFALKAQLFPPDLLLMLNGFRRREFEI